MVHFRDRQDAGRRLGQLLKKYQVDEVLVYALPRGGVVVAKEIAERSGRGRRRHFDPIFLNSLVAT